MSHTCSNTSTACHLQCGTKSREHVIQAAGNECAWWSKKNTYSSPIVPSTPYPNPPSLPPLPAGPHLFVSPPATSVWGLIHHHSPSVPTRTKTLINAVFPPSSTHTHTHTHTHMPSANTHRLSASATWCLIYTSLCKIFSWLSSSDYTVHLLTFLIHNSKHISLRCVFF